MTSSRNETFLCLGADLTMRCPDGTQCDQCAFEQAARHMEKYSGAASLARPLWDATAKLAREAIAARLGAPRSERAEQPDLLMKMNQAVGRGLGHQFFHDGLSGDLQDMSKEEAYIEGWRDAWLTVADDLIELQPKTTSATHRQEADEANERWKQETRT